MQLNYLRKYLSGGPKYLVNGEVFVLYFIILRLLICIYNLDYKYNCLSYPIGYLIGSYVE